MFKLVTKLKHSWGNLTHWSRNLSSSHRNTEWQKPTGYDVGIKVYNYFLRDCVPLVLKNPGVVTWYICGPTVYADAHIGHASCYMKFDIIRRILEKHFNLNVVMVMGITDVDDKIINRANKENCTIQQIGQKYEQEFYQDMELLGIQPPITVRVSDFIPNIISFCEALIQKEYAYVTSKGNVYFIVSKVMPQETSEESGPEFKIIDPLKRDPRDFALWKAAKQGEPYWDSPWGAGRPGWHIECSAMASHVFGANFDIHSGGADLKFPHHTNEISQSQAYHNCNQWVNYWLHSGLLHVSSDTKMSKSVGNVISIKDFLLQHDCNTFRIMCLQSNYRNDIFYSLETLTLAHNTLNKFQTFLNDAVAYSNGELFYQPFDDGPLFTKIDSVKESVQNALKNDFNTSEALKQLVSLVGDINCLLKPVEEDNGPKNLAVILAAALYIHRTLENFGVFVISKKMLPKSFVMFIDTIVQLRSKVRTYAISGKYGRPKKAKISNSDTNHSELETEVNCELKEMSEEMNKVQSSLCKQREKLKLCNQVFTDSKIDIIMSAVFSFRNSIQNLNQKIDGVEMTSDHGISFSESSYENGRKHNRLAYIMACDEVRAKLDSIGIAIKDLKYSSVWFPVIKKEMEDRVT